MKLSIIVVSFNTKTLLRKCLNSVISNVQNSNVQIELIVVDNGSTDGSKELIRNFQFSNSNVQKKLIFNTKNLGFAKAVNQGIEISQGKHVLLLNSDTRLKPKSLEKMVTFVNKNKNVGVVGPQLINPDGSIQPSCFNFPTIINAVKEFWFNQENKFSKYYPQSNEPIEVDALVGAAFLITDKALGKIGKLEEKYFLYYEDIDYCKRVRQAGLKVYYLPSVKIIHEHGASGKKISDRTKKWLIESSKKYHGALRHYLINFIIWSGQKCQKK